MRLVHQVIALLRSLFRSTRVDEELAEEMRFHLERDAQANVARGMSSEAARRAARLAFGSIVVMQERSRDERPAANVRQLARDLRFGARLLLKSPIFAATGILIVALGIGAATAIFSVVYGVLLRPLPYHEPERLVSVWVRRGTARGYFPTAADAADLRALRDVFSDVALVRSSTNLDLVGDGEPQHLQGARVSPNFFSVLGVSPILGRTFASDEDQPGRERVVVLSEALWRSRFGADSSMIGREIGISGTRYVVIGVMPDEMQLPSSTLLEAWIPAVLEAGELTRLTTNNYQVVARLAPHATLESARRSTSALAARLVSTHAFVANAGFTVDGMLDDAVREVRPALRLLLGAVSLLLLIACANLSNLFAARATARAGEFAVRLALGATRARLVVQAIAEATPVLAIGAGLGVTIAWWVVRAFVANAPAGLPRTKNMALSGEVVVFSFLVLVLAGVAASIAPAVQAWSSDFTTITKDGGRSSTGGRGQSLLRRLGVAAQVAFALPLLVGASLLVRSALHVARVDIGFSPDHVATLSFGVVRSKYASDQAVADYYARLVDAVRAVPGVEHAAIVNRIPLSTGQTNEVHFESPSLADDAMAEVDSRTITPDYFATLGVRLVEGRAFTEHDDASSPAVGIVDERVAHTIWPGRSALGARFRGPDGRWTSVVGVVAHVRTAGLEIDPRPQVYWSTRQWTQSRGVLAVRARGDVHAVLAPVERAIHAVDPDQAVYDARTMPEIVGRSRAQRRLTTMLMAGFGGMALALAAVGIYGVVAYGVTQRMREFGIRLALGATRGDVTRLVLAQGASMTGAGVAIGLVLALAVAGLMRSLVYGVAPRDLVSLVGATIVLAIVAAVASWVPSRRAVAADPSVTLRVE